MSEVFRSIDGNAEAELVIEKSRFLSYARHVSSEEEAREFLAEIKEAHRDATHCCYGFVADRTGALQRFSDDGEPQGTAGMPILDVVKNKGLFETAVAVVRYFGGIKLGAGGLVRAYSAAAAKALDRVRICLWQKCVEVTVNVDYPQIDGAMKFFASHDCEEKECEYLERVRYTLLVKRTEAESFRAELVDYLAGKVEITFGAEYFYPFPEK